MVIAVAAFVGGALGLACAWQGVERGLGEYRQYFLTKVGDGLKSSFIEADVLLLFGLSLLVTAALGIALWFLLGVVGAMAGVVVGLLLPRHALRIVARRRADRFIYQLPDALHALSSTLRSGVSLPKALEQLSTWQPAPLSQEFRLVLTEHQLGWDLSDALEHMHQRVPRPEVELLNGAINISRQVGGNLADTLESLAVTLTEKLTIEGKINALTAMGRLQGWVVACVPVGMGLAMYLLNPEHIEPMFSEFHGMVTLGVICVMMVLAIVTIRRIVAIDV